MVQRKGTWTDDILPLADECLASECLVVQAWLKCANSFVRLLVKKLKGGSYAIMAHPPIGPIVGSAASHPRQYLKEIGFKADSTEAEHWKSQYAISTGTLTMACYITAKFWSQKEVDIIFLASSNFKDVQFVEME